MGENGSPKQDSESRISLPMMTAAEPLRPVYVEWADRLERLLRLSAYPLAVKMCEKDEEIPELARRPLRDWGYRLNACQAMSISRRYGEMIAMKAEDNWCFEPPFCFGMTGGNTGAYEEGLEFFLEGHTRYPEGAKDLETARKWANDFPRFEDYGQYVAVVTAPLMKAAFEPDLVLLWLNPTQLNQVLQGITCEWGRVGITSTIAAHGGCVHYIVPPMKTGDFNISNPCLGDVALAMKEPGDLVVSIPISKLQTLLRGMEQIERNGFGMPVKYEVRPEGWLPDSYVKMRELMKM